MMPKVHVREGAAQPKVKGPRWMKRRNPKRAKQAYARNYGDRGDAVRSMPCLITAAHGLSVAAHARARGMGGCKGTRRDLVNLCQRCHLEAGEARTSQRAAFEALHGVDLFAEAERIAVRLDEEGYA